MSKSRILNYELLEQIGQGGMGEVYRARDLRLGRTVAVKFLHSEATGGDQQQRGLWREAVAASSLDHPNICTIFEVGEAADGRPFIVMALYKGRGFKALLDLGPLPVGQAVELAIQASRGLASAHAKGIIHRDIKPANLMLTDDGFVKILDFGLASMRSDLPPASPAGAIGTMAYMSPEQFRGDPVDSRADIWSLGVVIYELLTGKRPIESNPLALAVDVQTRDAPSVRRLRPDVPSNLADVLARALARDVSFRYRRIEDMIHELQLCEDDSSLGDSRGVVRIGASEAAPRPSVTAPGDRPTSLPSHPSVAILRLKNLSPGEEQAYFADGLTDELIHAVALKTVLHVVSRSSVFELDGKGLSIAQIGETLGVASVLEGSVRKVGSRVRIIVRLVRAADGRQLWSERYEREIDDVFAAQDEIAREIAERLESSQGAQKTMTREFEIDNSRYAPEVHELYRRGRYHWNRRALPDALECYSKALELDPEFALAHIGVANYHIASVLYAGADPEQIWPKVRVSVVRGMELGGNSPEARIVLGYLRTFEDWDWRGARKQFRIALEVAPGLVDPHLAYVMYLNQTRQFEAAQKELTIARALDPLSSLVRSFEISSFVYSGDPERAAHLGEEGVKIWPDALDLRLFHALALQALSRFEGALAQLRIAYAGTGESAMVGGFLGACLAEAGHEGDALTMLSRLQPREDGIYVPATARAFVLTALGRLDEALTALDQGARKRDGMICFAAVMPGFERLSGNPRFGELLRRVGMLDGP